MALFQLGIGLPSRPWRLRHKTAEMRLYVLEVFVSNLLAMAMLRASPIAPLDSLNEILKQMTGGAQKRTFPGFDAAMSDLLSAELEAAVTRLGAMASEQISVVLKGRKG